MTHTPDLAGKDATPLDPVERARWDAAISAVEGLAQTLGNGTVDGDGLQATANQLNQIPIEEDRILNAIHLPEDAGEYAAGLERILRRIPDGWGRWIGCRAGWYPLLVELDTKLAALEPSYRVHQVKEKFGTLRYYFGLTPDEPYACCVPYLDAIEPGADDSVEFNAYIAHCGSDEHKAAEAAAEPARQARQVVFAQMRDIVTEYEKRSASICEQTGGPGVLMVSRNGWYRTIDPSIAPEGYEIVKGDE